MKPNLKLTPFLRLTDIEIRLVVAGAGGGNILGVWVGRCKLLHLEWISHKLLMYSTGNYIQYPMISQNGKECFKRMSKKKMYSFPETILDQHSLIQHSRLSSTSHSIIHQVLCWHYWVANWETTFLQLLIHLSVRSINSAFAHALPRPQAMLNFCWL